MRTLIWKELREHVRWLPVGLIVIAAVCYLAAPGHHTDPLLATRLVTQLAIVTPLLAFALGIVQAYPDLQPAGNAYLNHRSVTPHQIFMAKVVAGFALYATAVVVPLLLLAAWIALQGMHWHPMRPAQVIPGMVFVLASFALHPAAMLMLARDASWWGTRVLPLVSAAAILLPLFIFLTTSGMTGSGLGLVVAAILIAWITFVARQGWHELSTDPPASQANRSLHQRWLLPAYLIAGALGVVFAVVIVVLATVESQSRPSAYEPQPSNGMAVDAASGKLWMLTFVQQYDPEANAYTSKTIGGDEVENGKTANPLRSENLPDSTRSFVFAYETSSMHAGGDGFFSNFASLSGSVSRYVYDERGYVIQYALYPRTHWQSTIAADGVYPPGKLTGQPFTGNPFNSMWGVFSLLYEAGYTPPFVDANGLYLLDPSSASIRQLIDRRIDALALIGGDAGHAPTLLIRSNHQLLEYQLIDGSGSDAWFQKADPQNPVPRTQARSLYDLPLTAKLVNTIDLPAELLSLSHFRIARSPIGWYIAPARSDSTVFHLTSQGQLETIAFQIQPETKSPPHEDRLRPEPMIAGALPGVVFIGGAAIDTWVSLTQPAAKPLAKVLAERPLLVATSLFSFTLVTLLSLWLTRRAAQRRGLSGGQMRVWSWSVLLLGLAAPLSVVALYRRTQREPCPQCQQPRRVDENHCEHCGVQWEPPQSEGIEIVDAHRLPQQAHGVPA